MNTLAFALSSLLCLFTNSLFYTYSGGSGTVEDPYQIGSVADWQALMVYPTDWESHFILTADIDLAGVAVTPVGNYYTRFKGVFDGNGHTISNIAIDQTDSYYMGLFGYIHSAGQVRNLGILNADIQGGNYTGGLAGANNGTLAACYVTGWIEGEENTGGITGYNYAGLLIDCSTTALVNGSYYIGGLAGVNYKGTIDSCYADGTVIGDTNVGGLVGFHWYNSGGLITNSYAQGSVAGEENVGGIAGYNYGGVIDASYATASVDGAYFIGGLAGVNNSGVIAACFAAGSVSGTTSVGGLTGYNWYPSGLIMNCYSTGSVSGTDKIGGLVGTNDQSRIITCYSTASVSGTDPAGGLAGYDEFGLITSCIWNIETCGTSYGVGNIIPDPAGVRGKMTDQMKMLSTFADAGWDFVNETTNGTEEIWTISEGVSYPVFYTGSWMWISQCTVTAGSKEHSDAIRFSGRMNAKAHDFLTADAIVITVSSADMANPYSLTLPINSNIFKKGIYRYTGKVNTSRISFKFDTLNRNMAFSAGNIDLTGLACPVTITVEIGDFSAQATLDESIVNGLKKPCPLPLIMGLKDSLAVTRSRVQFGRKDNTDSFTAQGTFTIAGDYDKNSPLVITLGTQTFTVSGSNFINKNSIESCKKAVSSEGAAVDAKLDFVKCTFTISIKNTAITESGQVNFGINCFGASLDGFAIVNIN